MPGPSLFERRHFVENTCQRCKALMVSGSSTPRCTLGHPIDPVARSPKEECERPLTYLALNEARKDYLETLRG